ncbi:hypothetical protein CTEN210_03536 [Chaetoceros tenuissimus]|uniref:Leucine-rich repeat domain-containing protein n=1 Tax=Chaetoceros tenuissimus TaxID=426638 RepID=A0AAD3CLG6_9STRA|nr:hypothetical protein CTEN210_03536 [Chaetoceros tenuissimus]
MRVQTEEWRKFVPGIRMYNGKKTFFWNGDKLWEGPDWNRRNLFHDEEERDSWQVVMVLPGVEVIPRFAFCCCKNLEKVIMADTVKRIEMCAFDRCGSLKFVRLSRTLEFIGLNAFWYCQSLTSIFIPPSCTMIEDRAFYGCKCMLILGLPQQVELGQDVFQETDLIKRSPFRRDEDGYGVYYDSDGDDDVEAKQWIKSMNNEEAYALHRACSSFNPIAEIIHDLVTQHGIKAMKMPNAIGITPSQYLAANTFDDISEKDIINRYISDMMGEVF